MQLQQSLDRSYCSRHHALFSPDTTPVKLHTPMQYTKLNVGLCSPADAGAKQEHDQGVEAPHGCSVPDIVGW